MRKKLLISLMLPMLTFNAFAAECFSFERVEETKAPTLPAGMAEMIKKMPKGAMGNIQLPEDKKEILREYMDENGSVVIRDKGWIYTDRKTLAVLDVNLPSKTYRKINSMDLMRKVTKGFSANMKSVPHGEPEANPGAVSESKAPQRLKTSKTILGLKCDQYESVTLATYGAMKHEMRQTYCTNPNEPKAFYSLQKHYEELYLANLPAEEQRELKATGKRMGIKNGQAYPGLANVHFDLEGGMRSGQSQRGQVQHSFHVTKISNECVPDKYKNPPAGYREAKMSTEGFPKQINGKAPASN